ncbi:MAG: hypothetical protein FK731_13180 [Asgard group archaeon]|nr:hypothetical protein [Asgard group archaeon]
MAAEAHWLFVTDKYSLVELIDSAIVVARFNQNELMRELIEIRCDLLKSKSYDDVIQILDRLLKLIEKITDKRLFDVINKIIDQLNFYRDIRIEYDKKVDKLESKAID